MDGFLVVDDGTHYFRYADQISRRAMAAVFTKSTQGPASYMQARLCNESLSDVPVMSFKGGDQVDPSDCKWVIGSEMQAYAAHFKKMQKGVRCIKVVITGKCTNAKLMIGYSTYYIYQMDASRRILAFLHEHPDFKEGKVAMIAAPNDAHHQAALAYIRGTCTMMPFGRICSNCGKGDAKLMKCSCRQARYCSKECQSAHWGEHRVACACDKRRPEVASE